ncbi:MAG TPA: LuxR C-terminal-related transcriptional regulator [Methylibium sp.]|nr:LuxR C-terminal-related transcriptional regulator [Methylibium sp.]
MPTPTSSPRPAIGAERAGARRPDEAFGTAPDPSLQFAPPSFAFEAVPTRAQSQLRLTDPFPRLVVVSAPPGYGKTVLLAGLYRAMAGAGRKLWLTLDDRDADLSALQFRLRAALQHAGFKLPDTMAGHQVAFHGQGSHTDSLAALLTQVTEPTVVFIDNLGFCVDRELGAFLNRLVFGHAAPLSLVLSSSREVPIDMARAKLEVGAVELSSRHMSFDRDSTAAVLRRAGIAALADADIDRIVSQTEGWPAAVRLVQVLLAAEAGAAPASRSAVDVVSGLQHFGGDHADMARMLTHRVLGGFDDQVVQFMAEMSLVRDFNAELAAHMTGRSEARAWLDMLVTRNVLIFPLDSRRRWFRFHTLMREFLLAEAGERVAPARRRELLERAAHWHRDRDDPVTAIEIALDAGSTCLAQELLDRVAHVVVGDQGQMGTLIHWVDRLVQAGGRPSLEAQVWFVWALCDSLQYERGRAALEDLDHRMAVTAAPDGTHALPSRLLFIRIVANVFIDRLDTAFDQASEWLSREDPADALTTATVIAIKAIAELERGKLTDARAHLQQARSAIERSQSGYGLAWVCILEACLEIEQANPAAAHALLVEGRERVVRITGPEANVVRTLDFVHARALLDLGRVADAREKALRGLASAVRHGILTSLEQGLAASVALWRDPARDEVQEQVLDRVASSYPARGALLLAASKVRRLLDLGELEAAQFESTRTGLCGPARPDTAPLMRERSDWLLARLEMMVAQGARDAVLDGIDALLKAARADGRDRDRIELLLVAADAEELSGRQRLALRHYSLAIALAAPGKVVQPFTRRAALWSRLFTARNVKDLNLVQPQERAFYERLRTLLGGSETASSAPNSEVATAEGLTPRQIQLLALLDEGLSNEQVADRLALSVTTVKWHLHNAYVTLGVRSRSAALARARALKLLGR